MKKNILSKILTLGVAVAPILVGTALISSSDITLNDSTSKNINRNGSVAVENPLTQEILQTIVAKKIKDHIEGITWDGSLIETDFVGITTVDTNAFKNSIFVKSVILPDTVKTINTDAFNGAITLASISALGVTTIAAGAFAGIPAIVDGGIKLTYSENIKFGNVSLWGITEAKVMISGAPIKPTFPTDGIINKRFIDELIIYENSMLATGVIWDGFLDQTDLLNATSVAPDAFKDNISVKSITLPDTVKSIGTNSFSGAVNLTSISALGATSIDANAFSRTTSITNGGIKLKWSNNVNATKAIGWGTTTDKLSIANLPTQPSAPPIIDSKFVNELVSYKINTDPLGAWDGSLVGADFVGATSVAANAFVNNDKVTSITLPDTVKSIGANAFSGTVNLTTISAVGVTSIGSNAFLGAKLLREINLIAATDIGSGAFSETNSISVGGIKLTYSQNIKEGNIANWGNHPIDKYLITNTPNLPVSTSIDANFIEKLIEYKNSLLPTGTIWNGILVESDFPSATNVAVDTFQGNDKVSSITLPDTVKSIGANAFSGAINLTSISALGVTSIGANAFSGMTKMSNGGIKLTYIIDTINATLADTWGTTANKLFITSIPDKPLIPTNKIITKTFVDELVTYKINTDPSGIWNGILVATDFDDATSVDADAFKDNGKVISIALPNTVTSIGANAFSGAINLTSISALGVTNIDANAFSGMTKMSNGGIKLTYSENIKPANAADWGVSDHDKLSIVDAPIKPEVPANGIITPEFVNELITYKNSVLATGVIWDGVLFASDFVGATSIAANAFQDKTTITSITLPNTVLSIGANAFLGTDGINGIGNNKINLKFSDDIKLGNAGLWGITDINKLLITDSPNKPEVPRTITIEFVNELITYKNSILGTGVIWDGILVATDFTGATSVAAGAFQNITEITSITLPNTILSIGDNAFDGTTGIDGIGNNKINLTYSTDIKEINAPTWGTTADKLSITGSPTTPEIPLIITTDFINQLINYKKSMIPTGVIWDGILVANDFTSATSVADGAFQNITEITSITLPGTVLRIGADAFLGTDGINGIGNNKINLKFSDDIKLGNAGLWGITDINKLLITDSPTKPVVPTRITPDFVNKLIAYKNSMLATGVIWDGTLVESDFVGATSIADNAFQGNNKVTSITLPNTVKLIGGNAFSGATSLTSISALGVTSIGANAFDGTTGIDGIGNNKINLTFSENIKPGNIRNWGSNNLDKYLIANSPINPRVPESINSIFINELITYKNSMLATGAIWDGTLVAADFIGATSVAAGAFQNITEITSITLPDTVLSIGADAFAGTTGINGVGNNKINLTFSENIKLGNIGNWGTHDIQKYIIVNSPINPMLPIDGIITTEFLNKLITYKNSMLATGVIWDGTLVATDFNRATSVAAGAFQNITEITSITLPDTVTSIGANAFAGTTGIDGVGNNKINLTFSEKIKPGNAGLWGITDINKLSIANAPNNPMVPESINSDFINQLIIYKNSQVQGLWDGVLVATDFTGATSVAANAFQDNTEITSITLPNTVTSIGADAFSGATYLNSISALGVTNIGANAFAGTTGITGIENSKINLTYSTNIKITNIAEWGVTADKLLINNVPTDPSSPLGGTITSEFVKQLVGYKNSQVQGLWDGVLVATDFAGATSIDASAFQDIKNITSITLPDTVTSIGDNAFAGASSLTNVLALGVTNIGANAFSGTTSITNGGIKLTGSTNINLDEFQHWGLTSEESLNITPIEVIIANSLVWTVTAISIVSNLALILLGVAGFQYYRKKMNEDNEVKSKNNKDNKISN